MMRHRAMENGGTARKPRFQVAVRSWLSVIVVLGGILLGITSAEASKIELEKSDHITFIGNALPERMNHFGWFETLLHDRFPEKELVVRNLGYAGDEIDERLRVQNYGSQHEWLRRTETDVIFACFGFNESFEGKGKVQAFKGQLADFITHVREQEYNGESAPKLVLLSPIAAEDHEAHDLPDGSKNNRRLALYTEAMGEVAAEHDVPFVNLFDPSKELYAAHERHLTYDSVHLDKWGYKQLAPVIDRRLFGERSEAIQWEELSMLRESVNEKNWHWFERYRVSDGYNVYGGRSNLSYVDDISNREVMKREMEVLEVQTANRDKKVWAMAQGNTDYEVKDDNLPSFIEVETNMPGELPGGKHLFLGPREAIGKMNLADNFKVNLYASEQQFPSLINPVQMAFDTQGRLWVAAWATYPHWRPTTPMDDKLLILEDTDDDGRADKRTVFADHLSNPTGFEFWNGGVLVARAPYLLFLKDTDGDGKADVRRRILSHLSAGDTHHTANSFVFGPGGGLYWGEGVFHRSQIETPYGPVRSHDETLWRFRPDTYRTIRFAPMRGFANPHGHVFTRWGQGFSHDATSARPYHDTVISGHLPYPEMHPSAPTLYDKRTRPLPGTGLLSSGHFPERMQGNLLVANVIGFRGILQYDLMREGSSFTAEEREPIIQSSDPNFRPADIQIGPDGAIYFTDWHNPIIGHMQHHIRDPSRDNKHGRVYRITYEGRDLTEPHRIEGTSISHLLDLLKEGDNHVRYRAKIELSERGREKVINAVDEWIGGLDPDAPQYTHHLLEGLWVHQWHNTVDQKLLGRLLGSEDSRARAAAVKVVCYWRRKLDRPLERLAKTVHDKDGLVRLETVRALSYFEGARAAEIALEAVRYEIDEHMDYVLGETLKALEPAWRKTLRQGEPFAEDNPDGLKRLLDRVGKEELVHMPHIPAVDRMVLLRSDIPMARRRESLKHLAKASNQGSLETLVNMIERRADAGESVGSLLPLLGGYDGEAMAPLKDRFREMAADAASPGLRQAGLVAVMTADGSAAPAWEIASGSIAGVEAFLHAIKEVESEAVRASAYQPVRSLMFGLPGELRQKETNEAEGIRVSYYDTLPENAKLSTFEGLMPSEQAHASRIGIDVPGAPGSEADGYGLKFEGSLYIEQAGEYRFGLTSDDGSRLYIDGTNVIDNDGDHVAQTKGATKKLGRGMHRLVLTYFESGGNQALGLEWSGPGFEAKPLAGKALRVESIDRVQRMAIRLLPELPEGTRTKCRDLAAVMRETDHVLVAAHAASRIDDPQWTHDQAVSIAEAMLRFGEEQPPSERGSDRFREAVAFVREVTSTLPPSRAKELDRKLEALVVKVVVIKAVPEKLVYDIEELDVAVEQPVEIRFKNPSNMPHNLLITRPGEMAAVGKAAQRMATQPNAFEKEFVPTEEEIRDKILWHTGLLNPGESEILRFMAPEEPGDYPYVCTFPGHWLTMNGTIHVREGN